MKSITQRINNICGQLAGISQMVEKEADCFEIIVQFKAVRSAIDSTMHKYIEENVTSCVTKSCSKAEQEKIEKLVKELSKNQ